MDALLNVTDRTSAVKVTERENNLKRLQQSSALSFEDELMSSVEKNSTKKKPRNEKLWNACVEAESLFVGKMLKEMKSAVHKSEWLHGGYAEDIFEDMLYDEYALKVSKNSDFGMAKMLYEELSRKL